MTENKVAKKTIEAAKRSKKNPRTALSNIGFSVDEVEEYYNFYVAKKKVKEEAPGTPGIKYEECKDNATLESKGDIQTLEELLATAKVDLNIWEVEKWICNKWAVGAKDADKNIQVTPLFQVKAWLKKKAGATDAKEFLNFFRDDLAKSMPRDKWDEVAEIDICDEPKYCLELCIPDLHLGKLVWGEEVKGASYDSNEAIRVFKNAVHDLIGKAPMDRVDKILLSVGNDFYNVDGEDQATTAGTPQSEDSRWQNTFKKGCKLLVETVAELAIDCHVQIILVQGNHDYERSFYLGEYLSAFFLSHPNVSVNNDPSLRKYFRYGNTLLGFTHGDKEVRKNLPLIMATEQKKDWADTEYKEFHLGHLHREGDEEIMGVKIRTISSLCAPDAWHTSKGYVGQTRSAKAFLYHFNNGLEAQYYYSLKQ